MKKCLIYEDINGNCRIIKASTNFQQSWESEENAIARLHEAAIPEVTEFMACELEKLPNDLTFRSAWKKGDLNEPIKIDMIVAISLHRDRLKHTCEVKISQLNMAYEVAVEDDNLPLQVSIKKTKQILRTLHECDLTHCKTIEDLKYAIPKELHDVWVFYPPVP
jgi:iron uptake system EfeUOB component EfeO/EfeM